MSAGAEIRAVDSRCRISSHSLGCRQCRSVLRGGSLASIPGRRSTPSAFQNARLRCSVRLRKAPHSRQRARRPLRQSGAIGNVLDRIETMRLRAPRRFARASSSRSPRTSRIPSRIACIAGHCSVALERAIPFAHGDVDRQYRHSLPLRLLQQLRRLIEPHRLTVDEPGKERRGPMTFQPARNIGQQRERRRMRFRKAVFAEAFDLFVDLFGERLPSSRSRACPP